jgi:hypothetical protein
MNAPKGKGGKGMLTALSKALGGLNKKHNAALIALPTAHAATQKSFRKLRQCRDDVEVRNLNPVCPFEQISRHRNPKALSRRFGKSGRKAQIIIMKKHTLT